MRNLMGTLHGMKVYVDRNLVKIAQVRFPKTRKKRILKKWRKSWHNYRSVPDTNWYTFGTSMVCHPSTFAALQKRLSL